MYSWAPAMIAAFGIRWSEIWLLPLWVWFAYVAQLKAGKEG